ncbi:MAG: thiamine pyrophosphate-dependent dehydrogenase E1 component subunit alpha [Chloroflexota bacterium]
MAQQQPPLTAPLDATERDLLLRIYRLAVVTRTVDERLWILSRQGQVSFVLTARGHEIAQIASAATLRRGLDTAWPYYRDMAVGFTLGVTPYELFLGAYGRGADPHSGGRQLTTHLSSPRLGIGSISSSIAAQIPHAVGAAYAAKVLGTGSVAVTWFGDGATSEGATHESMNLAGIHALPVVFFCENNGLAISVPQSLQMAVATVAERGAAYGMPGVRVDGTDPLAVYRASTAAVERARRGEGPTLIEAVVPRITAHSSQDDEAYRTDEERMAAAAADPLPRLRELVLELGLMPTEDEQALQDRLRQEIVREGDRAASEPLTDPSRARQWLFAGDPPHPLLARLEAGGVGTGGLDG